MIVASNHPPEVAMRKRRDPSATEGDDGPRLISL
jgi:hypothetical protein